MKKERDKINQKPKTEGKKFKKLIMIFFILIILVIGAFIANDYIILDQNTTTNLIINNKNITANLKKDVMIEGDIIYLSKQDIANFFDKYIYEEKNTNQIITTYEKKIATIGFEEDKININGADKEIYAHAIKKDDTIYLPISEMQDVYDIELKNMADTKIVTIDTKSKEQKQAIVSSDVAVKSSKGLIAKTVDRVGKGQSVIVVSKEDDYVRIRTEKGKLGYIKTDKLANEFTVRDNMDEEKQIKGKVNLVWDYYSIYASAPDRSGQEIEGINVVSPSFMFLDNDGSLKANIGEKGKKYIEWAHSQGYKVWPMVSNAEVASKDLSITSKIMNSYENRKKIIDSIVYACSKYDLDGVNIDFENMKEEDKDMFSRFIIELTPRLKEMGLTTSVDVTAPDGGETWSMCFDRNVIGNVSDYIVFMAYDEYGSSSNKAGTTAGCDWIKLNLKKFLQTEEIKPEKIILGIPLFTRVWTTSIDGKVSNKTIAMKNIDNTIPSGTEKKWDDELKQYYVEYTEGTNKKQIWIEDINSLKEKVLLIQENELGGVASWQKGMETDDVWKMIKENLK